MMASGQNAKKSRKPAPVVSRSQGLPWLTIAAVVVVLLLAGGIFSVVYSKNKTNDDKAAAVAPFVPSATDKDPSTKITDIFAGKSTVAANGTLSFTGYKAALHVTPDQRVAYDRYPPIGGPHDAEWADCNGDVYPTPMRNENMVHPLEHGAIWITYNPATIAAGDLDKLKAMVTGQSFLFMSPYPGLDSPISLQSWAHQLKVTSAGDVRIQQFITALRLNQYTTPELGASCSQPGFTPPALITTPPTAGADTVQMDGTGATDATGEAGAMGAGTPASEAPASSGAVVSAEAPAGATAAGAASSAPVAAKTSNAKTTAATTSK